jgi:hypothetical protein
MIRSLLAICFLLASAANCQNSFNSTTTTSASATTSSTTRTSTTSASSTTGAAACYIQVNQCKKVTCDHSTVLYSNGMSCDDSDICTENDVCTDGTCSGDRSSSLECSESLLIIELVVGIVGGGLVVGSVALVIFCLVRRRRNKLKKFIDPESYGDGVTKDPYKGAVTIDDYNAQK